MANNAPTLSPKLGNLIGNLGVRLSNARLRQRTSQSDLARSAGISVATLRKLETGDPTVGLASFLAVLESLGMADELNSIADADPIGRSMLDERITGLPRGRREVWHSA